MSFSTTSVTIKYQGRSQLVPIDVSHRVKDLHAPIASVFGLPAAQQRLTYNGQVMGEDQTLTEFNIKSGDVIVLDAVVPLKQIVADSWETVKAYAPTVAYYAALPLIVYVAYKRRDVPYSNLKTLLKFPFID